LANEDDVVLNYAGGGRRRFRKLGPTRIAIVMTAALTPLILLVCSSDGLFLQVVNGRLFAGSFSRMHVGSAIGNLYLMFTILTAVMLPYVAVARWLGDRRTRAGYWVFAAPAVALCLCLLIILTVPFWWLVQYVQAMGSTPRRIHGLIYGVGGCVAVLAFLTWAIWPPRHRTDARST